MTFPYNEAKEQSDMPLQQRISHELALLEDRISNNMHVRQQEEYAVADRKGMYALPQDFRMLSQRVTEVLQNVFFASRFDETKFHTTLRGIYFVSSCQPADVELLNNNTLIQKWRNVINHKNRYRQPIYHKKVIMKIGLLAMWLTGNNISSSSCLAM